MSKIDSNRDARPPVSPTRIRRGQGAPVIIATLAIVLVVLAGIGFGAAWLVRSAGVRALPAAPMETSEQKHASLEAAFAKTTGEADPLLPAPLTQADLDGIRLLIRRFDRAMQRSDAWLMGACYDTDRIYQEMVRDDGLPPLGLREERQFLSALRVQLGSSVVQELKGTTWTKWDLRRITSVEAVEDEAIIYLRVLLSDQIAGRVRWWVRRQDDGSWRIYDSEDLNLGLRMSAVMGMSLRIVTRTGSLPRWINQVQQLLAVNDLALSEEYEAAENDLRNLASARFPRMFEAFRLASLASMVAAQGRYDEADGVLDGAFALRPDLPLGDYLRGSIRLGHGRHDEALAAIDAYVALLGADRDTAVLRSAILLAMDRTGEAIEEMRAGLDHDPDAIELLVDLAVTLPESERGEVVERFTAMRDPAASAESLLETLQKNDDLVTMEVITSRLRSLSPDDTNADYYEAQVRMRQDRPDEAVSLLESSLPRAPAEEREAFRYALAEALVQSDRPVDAYGVYRNEPSGLDTVVDLLFWTNDTEAVRLVLLAHQQHEPDDPRLLYYTGEVELSEEHMDLAVDAYRKALDAAADNPDLRKLARAGLVYALYQSGRGMEALETVAPAAETARQVAAFCINDENALMLGRVLAAYRAHAPDDALIPLWQGEIHWIRAEYEAAAELLAAAMDRLQDDVDSLAHAESHLVRSLVRLGRYEEALAAAQRSTARDGNPYFEVVVYATMGQVDGTAIAFARCIEQGYDPDTFYDDLDAGPALADATFANLRAANPRRWTETQEADAPTETGDADGDT